MCKYFMADELLISLQRVFVCKMETRQMKWIQIEDKKNSGNYLEQLIDSSACTGYVYVFAFDIASIESFFFLSLSLPLSLVSLTLDFYWFTCFFLSSICRYVRF